MIILALDGLEYDLVEKFNCLKLMQKYSGKTNIKEFSLPKTVILWASFLTGRNMEPEVKGDLWTFKIEKKQTFLKNFKDFKVIDLPSFAYGEKHKIERDLLKAVFVDGDKRASEKYNEVAWKNHQKVKNEFLKEVTKDYQILIGYFALSDVIGHLNFGDLKVMGRVYQELESITKETQRTKPKEKIIIISDHGMKTVGKYGDHTMAGFYSLNFPANLAEKPKITDFYQIIIPEAKQS